MQPEIQRLELFELEQPMMCGWCRHAAFVYGGNPDPSLICWKTLADMPKNGKTVVRPLPPNVERRSFAQFVNFDESHECFEPTPKDHPRLGHLKGMGLL